MREKFKLYREDEKPKLAPVIKMGYTIKSPGVSLYETDMMRAFEPIMQNRFLITFPNEFNISEFFVKDVTSPSYIYGNIFHHWDDMTITFYDQINPSLQQRLFNIIGNLSSTPNYTFKIKMIDVRGNVFQKWIIDGFLKSIEIGPLSYENNSLAEPKMTIGVNNIIFEQ